MRNLHEIMPMHEGENFHDWWMRCWYAGELSPAAYGDSCRIARIRRGRYVRIPSEWRGKVTSSQTIRKRQSKGLRKHRRSPYAGYVVKGAEKLTTQEQRAPKIEDYVDEFGYA